MKPPFPTIQSAPSTATVPVILFVPGSMRSTLPAVWSLTQSEPAKAVRPFGSVPVLIFLTTFPPVIRQTVPSELFAPQIEPKPHSRSYGPKPTCTVFVTLPVRESMRVSVLDTLPIAQTAPGAATRLKTRMPAGTRFSTFPVFGLMRMTSPEVSEPAHTEPPLAARPYVHWPTGTFVGDAAPAKNTTSTAAIILIGSWDAGDGSGLCSWR